MKWQTIDKYDPIKYAGKDVLIHTVDDLLLLTRGNDDGQCVKNSAGLYAFYDHDDEWWHTCDVFHFLIIKNPPKVET